MYDDSAGGRKGQRSKDHLIIMTQHTKQGNKYPKEYMTVNNDLTLYGKKNSSQLL